MDLVRKGMPYFSEFVWMYISVVLTHLFIDVLDVDLRHLQLIPCFSLPRINVIMTNF